MADKGFLSSIDLSTHDKAIDRELYRKSDKFEIHGGRSDRTEEATAYLEASDTVLKLNRKAASAVNDATNASDSYAAFEQSRKQDQERVKDVLNVGKGIFSKEINGLKKDEVMSDEVQAQANAIFAGQRKRGDENANANGHVGPSLKYMQKGVKKMVKGFDSDA